MKPFLGLWTEQSRARQVWLQHSLLTLVLGCCVLGVGTCVRDTDMGLHSGLVPLFPRGAKEVPGCGLGCKRGQGGAWSAQFKLP